MRRQKLIAVAGALAAIGGGGVIAFMRVRACTSAGEARPLDETVRTDELVVRYSTDFAATRLGPNTVGLSRTVLRPLGLAGVEMLMFDQTPLRDDGKDLHAISDEMIEPLFAADRAQGDRIDHIEGRAATCNGRRAWETTAVEEGRGRARTSHRVCVFVRGESVFIVAYHVPTDLAERDEHVLHRIAEAFEPTEKAAPAAATATLGPNPEGSENDRVIAGLRPRFRACYNASRAQSATRRFRRSRRPEHHCMCPCGSRGTRAEPDRRPPGSWCASPGN